MTLIAPVVFADDTFALKGGTAINLFYRNMPRLSVDLDLVFCDHACPRGVALNRISQALKDATSRLSGMGFQTRAVTTSVGETKLLVRRGLIEVKVEVNIVMRGTVYPVRVARMVEAARSALLADMEIPLLAMEDVYGGKLVAALDRQHPRDLFDVLQLFAFDGLTSGVIRAFVVYLASSNRPLHEVLSPSLNDLQREYQNNFQGMTVDEVTIQALMSARQRLISELPAAVGAAERHFLRTLVRLEPDWDALEIPHIRDLPAIQWKLQNLIKLNKTNKRKYQFQVDALDSLLQAA